MSATTARPVRPRSRSTLVLLLASVAIANVAYTILIPFVPVLSDRFGMSSLTIGIAFGGFAATKALAQPVGGRCADRLGARPTAVAGLVVAAAATGALAFAQSGTQVVSLRLLWGVGEGLALPALYQMTSSLGRLTNVGEARAMGWYGAAAVTGMTAGPGLLTLLSGLIDFRGAFLLGASLTLVSVGCVAFALRVPEPEPTAVGDSFTRADHGRRARSRPRPVRVLVVVAALGLADLANNFIYAALEPVVPLYAGRHLSASQRSISVIFFVGLMLFAAVSAIAARPIAKVGYLRATAAAFALQTLGLAITAVTDSLTVFAIAFLVVMAVQPAVYVAVRASVAEVGRHQQGMAFGWFGLVSDIGWIAGPIAASTALNTSGAHVFAGLALLAGVAAIGTAISRSRLALAPS